MNYYSYYEDKKVLITGHTGFKGSWLSLWLLNLGAKVIGYAQGPYTSRDNFVVSGLHEKMIDIRGDIRDFNKLNFVIKKYQPEIIFHLAAQPILRLSYKIPRETVETNVMGTINVLEAFRKSDNSKTLIIITSDKCYENKEWIWGYREIDPMGGYDPYSASKGAVELITSVYIRSFFNPNNYEKHGKVVATARAGNVIGGGDWQKDRIIPDIIKALEKNEVVKIRNPDAVRPWQFVLEPLNGYLLLALKIHDNPNIYLGPWNFGPNPESIISVKEVVEKIIKYYGKGTWNHVYDNELHESKLLNLDISKARFILGWKPKLSIDEAIKMTVDWYKNYHKKNIGKIIDEQIDKYMND